MTQLRLKKTKREQLLIKKAGDIGLRCMEAYMEAIRNGKNRYEAEKIRAKTTIDYGGEFVGGATRLNWTGGIDYHPLWLDNKIRKHFKSKDINKYRNWVNLPDDFPFFVSHFESKFQSYWGDIAWHESYFDEPEDKDILDFGNKKIKYLEAKHDFGDL